MTGGEPSELTVVCKDVSYVSMKRSKTDRHVLQGFDILRNVNMIARPGEVLAIMGPSGCGKTSLLNILAGRTHKSIAPPTSEAANNANYKLCKGAPQPYGEIYFNGQHVDYAGIQQYSRYVMQSDCLLPFLTVQETITFGAKLRLSHLRPKALEARVSDVITKMGLSGCRHVKVGDQISKGISGGQKKRVAIALELLSEPSLIYLDEPTSGLDSSLAFDVVKTLQRLARSGKTIVCTIHQPRSQIFSLFDKLCFLSKGKIVYYGPRTEAAAFASSIGHPIPHNFNVPDFFLDLLSADVTGTEAESRNPGRNVHTLSRMQRGASFAPNQSFLAGGGGGYAVPLVDESAYEVTDGSLRLHAGQELVAEPKLGKLGSFQREVISLDALNEMPGQFERSKWGESLRTDLETASLVRPLTAPMKRRKRDTFANWVKNVATLTHRGVINNVRNPLGIVLSCMVVAVMTLITGLLFFKLKRPDAADMDPNDPTRCLYYFNFMGVLGFGGINNSFAAIQIMLDFPNKRPMYNREVASKLYHPSAYFIGSQLGDLPFYIFLPLIHSLVLYWMVGLGFRASHFFMYLLMVCLVAFAANSWAQVASFASKNVTAAAALTPVGVIVAALLSGLWINDKSVPYPWKALKYLTWIRYGISGFIQHRFPKELVDSCAELPAKPNAAGNFALLFALGLGYRLLSYPFLRYTNTRIGIEA